MNQVRRRWWRLLSIGIAAALLAPSGMAMAVPAGTATFQEFAIPSGSHGQLITKGPDNNLWFTEASATPRVGRVTPGGSVTEFSVANPGLDITTGPDHNLWYSGGCCEGATSNNATRLTTSGSATSFFLPPFTRPWGITTGADGNLWTTASNRSSVVRITPAGAVDEFPLLPGGHPEGITSGPDHMLWVTDWGYNSLFRVDPSTGTFTQFPIPYDANFDNALPTRIVTGPDGDLWFTEAGVDKIGRMTTAGQLDEFQLPTADTLVDDITVGPDANLWFTEPNINRIGRITTAGTVTEIHTPPLPPFESSGIATGPDGKLWFTELAAKVANFDPDSIKPPPPPCITATTSIVLKHDIGPCPGDGILVTANNVTIDLHGHQVVGAAGKTGDFAGIHLLGVSGVTVTGGTVGAGVGRDKKPPHGGVTGFDAGVFIDHGSANTVKNLNLHDNLGLASTDANLGDGVAVVHSANNTIAGNWLTNNGMYDGIGILGVDSNANNLRNNVIQNTNDEGYAGNEGEGTAIITNPFLEVTNPRRGESLHGNNITGNVIRNNMNSGVSSISNVDATIGGNTIRHNGFRADGSAAFPGNGIATRADEMATTVTNDLIKGNTVVGNAGNGITIGTDQNRILANHSLDNAAGEPGFDLSDYNNCSTNVWSGNFWGSGGFNPPCTAAGGSGPTVAASMVRPSMAQPPVATHRGRRDVR